MTNLISIWVHEGNKDPSAKLVTPSYQRDAVYSTSKGFIAVYMMSSAIEGYFPSLIEAQHALDILTISNGATTGLSN